MATLKFDGRKTVGAFAKQFEDQFDATLKVYKDSKGHVADKNDSMASVQVYNAPTTGDLTFRADISVDAFCKKVEQEFGYVVIVFRKDGRVSVPGEFPLSKLELIPYQASKSTMDQLVQELAHNVEKANLSQVTGELNAKRRDIKDKKQKKDIEEVIQFLDELEDGKKDKDYIDTVRKIVHKYGVLEVLSLIGAILSGNIIAIGTNSAAILEKIYDALKKK
jgi:hypothetical protein